MQLIIENETLATVKAIELIENNKTDSTPLGPIIGDALADLPLIKTEITVLSKEKLDLRNCSVEDSPLNAQSGCTLVIATDILSQNKVSTLS